MCMCMSVALWNVHLICILTYGTFYLIVHTLLVWFNQVIASFTMPLVQVGTLLHHVYSKHVIVCHDGLAGSKRLYIMSLLSRI